VSLTCRPSTIVPTDSVTLRHCADAVLSLADKATIDREAVSTLTEFIARWIQSPSGYDSIFALTIPADWARIHKPVLSTRAQGHIQYCQFNIGEPNGQVILCPWMCKQPVNAKVGKTYVRQRCLGCGVRCSTPKVTSDRSTLLGRCGLVKTPYPREQYKAEWEPFTASLTPHTTLPLPSPNPSCSSLPPAPFKIRIPPIARSQSPPRLDDHRRAVAMIPPPTPQQPASVKNVKRPIFIDDTTSLPKRQKRTPSRPPKS
jgi:hypothetical protein